MSTRLVIEENTIYEIDEDCLACAQKREQERQRVKKQTAEKVEHKGPASRR